MLKPLSVNTFRFNQQALFRHLLFLMVWVRYAIALQHPIFLYY
ncbi:MULTISPECIES: hypothetical protein [Okeania]|nr:MULTISPECIES: hypothetical protein [Okeania]